jgi:hypothetical protein
MTSIAQPTAQTAPRDFEVLKKMGRFGLRTLAQELDIISKGEDEASIQRKSAFLGMSTDEQANAILTALKALDAQGGAPAAAAPQQTAPAAAPATNGAAGKLQRTPVTKTESPAAQTVAPAGNLDLSPFMKALQQSLENDKTIMANLVELHSQVAELRSLAGINISTLLLVAEKTVAPDREEVLNFAIEETQNVINVISTALGKAKAK